MSSILSKWLQMVVRGYQIVVSPWFGSCCRFTPSCSHYAMEALQRHGAFKGSYYTVRRLLRCHPWGGNGYDPVPEASADRKSSTNSIQSNSK